MASTRDPSQFAMHLLQQDEPLSDSQYKEYRMNLESALTSAERREKLAGHVTWIAFAVAFVLMFAGGSKVFGSFDPWDKDATILSVTLGAIYVIASIVCPIALASYFSRFRPRVRNIKDQIRDTNILALHSEIAGLRKQIAAMTGGDGTTP